MSGARSVAALAALALLTQCSSSVDRAEPSTAEDRACDLAATSGGRVTLWHAVHPAYQGQLDLALARASAAAGVEVEAVHIDGGTDQVIRRWREAAPEDRPDLVLAPDDRTALLAGSGLTVPVGSCLDDGPPLVPAIGEAFRVDGALQAVPFAVSSPVLVYDRRDHVAAGLDPDDPPATLSELRSTCERIVDRGAATTCLVLDAGADGGGSWFVEQWHAQLGLAVLEPDNGRGDEPPTEVNWDDDTAVEHLELLQDMLDDGLAVDVGTNTGNLDDLLRLVHPRRPASMTIHTSASLGGVVEALSQGLYPEVELGVGPLPGPGRGALAAGTAVWITRGGAGADAWEVAAALASPPVQARWAAATGYVPVTAAATEVPVLRDAWQREPGLRVAYDQLAAVEPDPLRLAPLAGPRNELREVLSGAVGDIFRGEDARTRLATAADQAEDLLRSYAETRGG